MSDAKSLILALPHPTILVGQDERIIGINEPAKQLVGMDCEGMPYITALRQPALLDAVEATLKDHAARTTTYLGNDGVQGTTFEVSVRCAEVSSGLAVVLSYQDLTALEQAEDMRRDFVANVSHEMRTPLTSLQGFIETLRGPAKNDPAAIERFLGIMDQEAGRMHRLVEDLLSLSRVESDVRVRPTTEVHLQRLVNEVLAALTPVAAAKTVTLVPELPEEDIEIVGDREQLWQVFSNLIENAIKYGVEGGEVKISMTGPEHERAIMRDGVQITVRDNGIGIPSHAIARLTERFYRVDSHRSREVGGTGLGLAIVKHIINRHRGRLRISSVIGEGSEFKVILPVERRPASQQS
ncbi:two-component system, OmpR family, phosphate regulon sensor histidine kinase PhoR [Octadecabacter temperatus]|uniref:histidine kinase n=1 Tax=Octadecabacter temperatus TaxID=1458307 RepID=A0A0K0Y4S2_9RHOB|nr:ATP-binding protein [Octadecabacter temperatus]AKS45998.1 Alkaline phosphatase synthesis sensor protein PhoR [Octadecabacter temperatus]SIO05324.1 two-component system, OmpR family, phosphate regulon sensor histidine kinase PhoR [Octadecabacter temperatus]